MNMFYYLGITRITRKGEDGAEKESDIAHTTSGGIYIELFSKVSQSELDIAALMATVDLGTHHTIPGAKKIIFRIYAEKTKPELSEGDVATDAKVEIDMKAAYEQYALYMRDEILYGLSEVYIGDADQYVVSLSFATNNEKLKVVVPAIQHTTGRQMIYFKGIITLEGSDSDVLEAPAPAVAAAPALAAPAVAPAA